MLWHTLCHLGQSENWILFVLLAKCNVWRNTHPSICQSIGCHFKYSVDTFIPRRPFEDTQGKQWGKTEEDRSQHRLSTKWTLVWQFCPEICEGMSPGGQMLQIGANVRLVYAQIYHRRQFCTDISIWMSQGRNEEKTTCLWHYKMCPHLSVLFRYIHMNEPSGQTMCI